MVKRYKVKKIIYIVAGIPLLIVTLVTLYSFFSAGRDFSEAEWLKTVQNEKVKDLYSNNKNDEEFFNPWYNPNSLNFFKVLAWKLTPSKDYTDEEKSYLPKQLTNVKERIKETEGDFILWIGHNTFLLRTGETYWITDPMFSKRALFPARKTGPALTILELNELVKRPNIIITHNHYDHLDEDSIKKLPPDSKVYCPKGLGKYISEMNKTDIHEMNWWDEIKLNSYERIIALPAQHWSLRLGVDRNTTLWASFLLKTENYNIYFAGDSGYYVGFKEIGRRYPGIDYAFMPTTAYHPRWFMHYQHMNIEENLKAFEELGAKFFIPTQWGTFKLADEPAGHPALELKREIKEKNLDLNKFKILDIGEILPIKPVVKN